jgi:tetratricopeptide (TPR) repeat protein
MLYANPLDASVQKLKGDTLLLLRERLDNALDAYTRAITYGERSADVYYGRGEAYYMLRKYYRSLKDYKKVLSIDPDHQSAQQRREHVAHMMIQSFMKRIAFW